MTDHRVLATGDRERPIFFSLGNFPFNSMRSGVPTSERVYRAYSWHSLETENNLLGRLGRLTWSHPASAGGRSWRAPRSGSAARRSSPSWAPATSSASAR